MTKDEDSAAVDQALSRTPPVEEVLAQQPPLPDLPSIHMTISFVSAATFAATLFGKAVI